MYRYRYCTGTGNISNAVRVRKYWTKYIYSTKAVNKNVDIKQ